MDQVIVAFESSQTAERIRDILESGATASCVLCRTADQVRRAVHKFHITAVVCGFKLADQGAEALFSDLPPTCAMLVLAPQNLLELLQEEDIFRLATPVSKGDLTGSVRMLLQMGRRLERTFKPRRSSEEQVLIDQAKALLMERSGMSEAQAHRFLQKTSMDNSARLVQTAQMILDSAE